MRKKNILIILLIFHTIVLSQSDLKSIRNLANEELDSLKQELKNEIENQNTNQINSQILETYSEIEVNQSDKKIDFQDYYGYDFFIKDINFYDNIPASENYILGPGDEIIVSLWGQSNSRFKHTISKNGQIYFENIGFLNLSNKTISQAEDYLKKELSKIFSTLDNNSTNLSVELQQVKSINVYFTGELINPGVHIIHPFSDIFTALIQAGGISKNGSLRKIEAIRNSEVIATYDFYDFFIDGKYDFKNFSLKNGDIIHIPPVKSRVHLTGEVNRPGFYEIKESESLFDIIQYAGGLLASASNKATLKSIIPNDNRLSDDLSRNNEIFDLSIASKVFLNDGSQINFLSTKEGDNDVTVFGRVFFPGNYPAYKLSDSSNTSEINNIVTLKDILDVAGGFDNATFRKTIDEDIVVLRLSSDQYYAEEFIVNYEDAENFNLEINDKIFVYESSNYRNDFLFTILGEVNKPGTYPLKKGLKLADALEIAGGVTDFGSIDNIKVSQRYSTINNDLEEESELINVSNISSSYQIQDRTVINFLPITNIINVEGNVYSPGLVAYESGMTMYDAIEIAGGYKPYTLKNRIYVKRANGEIEKANLFRGRAKRVRPGDSIFVPVDPDPQDFNVTSFVADLASTLANIAAILLIVDNNTN